MSTQKERKSSDVFVKKLSHIVSLITMAVMILGGLMAGVRMIKIAYRSFLVMLVVMVVSRIVIRVMASYEEIHSGKA